MRPGIYRGMPMKDYLAIRAVSSGLLVDIDQRCPLAAWHGSWLNPNPGAEDSTRAQGVGTLAHEVLLEGTTDCLAVIDPRDHPGKRGGIPDGWTNDSIREARDFAIAAGKVPIFPEKFAAVKAMVATAQKFIDSLRESEPAIWAAFQPSGGESEVVIVWEEKDGTLCKIRPDRIAVETGVMVNYKTTLASAEPDGWFRRQATTLGYPLASAFYRRGARAVLGRTFEEVWLAQEQEAPNLCSLVGLDRPGLVLANARMEQALRTWSDSVGSRVWAGYPNRVAYPETPRWEMDKLDEIGIPYEPEKLWEKPTAKWNENDPISA